MDADIGLFRDPYAKCGKPAEHVHERPTVAPPEIIETVEQTIFPAEEPSVVAGSVFWVADVLDAEVVVAGVAERDAPSG